MSMFLQTAVRQKTNAIPLTLYPWTDGRSGIVASTRLSVTWPLTTQRQQSRLISAQFPAARRGRAQLHGRTSHTRQFGYLCNAAETVPCRVDVAISQPTSSQLVRFISQIHSRTPPLTHSSVLFLTSFKTFSGPGREFHLTCVCLSGQ